MKDKYKAEIEVIKRNIANRNLMVENQQEKLYKNMKINFKKKNISHCNLNDLKTEDNFHKRQITDNLSLKQAKNEYLFPKISPVYLKTENLTSKTSFKTKNILNSSKIKLNFSKFDKKEKLNLNLLQINDLIPLPKNNPKTFTSKTNGYFTKRDFYFN